MYINLEELIFQESPKIDHFWTACQQVLGHNFILTYLICSQIFLSAAIS